MPWNENDDTARGKNERSNERRNEPPDLDELFAKMTKMFGRFGGANKSGSPGPSGHVIEWILLAVLVALFVAWVASGFHVIDQQERGVLFRLGKYQATLQPGLQWQPPLVDTIETVNTTRIREMSTQGRMLTRDENIIQATVLAQYRVIDPKKYLIDLRNPERTLANALDGALRHVVGSSDMNTVLTDGRAQVATIIRTRLQDLLDEYESGMEIVKVNIEKTQAPAEVQDAFDDVIKAREDRQRFQNQADAYQNQIIPQARGAAKRMIAEAEGYKAQVVNIAQGQAIRFEKLLTEYNKAPQVTQKRLYLEAQEEIMTRVSKVVIDGKDGNNITILPLEALLQRARTAKKPLSSSYADTSTRDSGNETTSKSNSRSGQIDSTRRGL